MYESVCSFLNRFGGDIFLGISNPAIFAPTVYLEPELIEYEGKTIIHVHIPPSSEVHSYKKEDLSVCRTGGEHPWKDMGDMELLKSAGLYGIDLETGKKGYNLAAIMLLGKDDIILNACPAYATDALVRKINVDRYDDREIIKTNLVESFDRLMELARKHLLDKLFLEETYRKSLKNSICFLLSKSLEL